MNSVRKSSENGRPIVIAFEGVSHVHMVGGAIDQKAIHPRLSRPQILAIEAKMKEAIRDGVPLVITLWPKTAAPRIHGLIEDKS